VGFKDGLIDSLSAKLAWSNVVFQENAKVE